ncbi:MAG TPA: phage tail protein, partial [Longimicrobiaceae bacterium]|nr:phage tail protein [Longimicrobiaceae bacterium]
MPLEDDHRVAGTFNFVVSLRRSADVPSGLAGVEPGQGGPAARTEPGGLICDGGFQECTGLDIEMDVQELQEGGRNDGVIRRVGRGKYGNLVLKRGMFHGATGGRVSPALWEWLQGILRGVRPVMRCDGVVQVLAADRQTVLATWTFTRGLPARISGPQLNARTGEIAIEELQIAHEGLR